MLTLLAALPPAWGEGGGLAAPFSPLDYGAICTLSALASSGEAGGIWAQTDGAGNPLALVSARFLSLAIPYPQERGEELRLFLSGFPCLTRQAPWGWPGRRAGCCSAGR